LHTIAISIRPQLRIVAVAPLGRDVVGAIKPATDLLRYVVKRTFLF